MSSTPGQRPNVSSSPDDLPARSPPAVGGTGRSAGLEDRSDQTGDLHHSPDEQRRPEAFGRGAQRPRNAASRTPLPVRGRAAPTATSGRPDSSASPKGRSTQDPLRRYPNDMDTWSCGEVAERLGVSTTTIRSTVTRLGMQVTVTPGGHRRFALADIDQICRSVGATPHVDGLTPEETRILAALARHPFGLRSARAAARASGVSPTTAGRSLSSLRVKGLAYRDYPVTAENRARRVGVWHLRLGNKWYEIAATVIRTVPPAGGDPSEAQRIPLRFWHLFWNQNPGALTVSEHGEFIAVRMLRSTDIAAAGWALHHLPTAALQAAKRNRGIDARTAAMTDNVIAARS